MLVVGIIATGASSDNDWSDNFQKYIPFHVKNASDPSCWRDAFVTRYVKDHFQEVNNMTDPNEWRKAFMTEYVHAHLPHLGTMRDANEWRDAYMKMYGEKHLSDVRNKSDANEWRDAYMKAYAGSLKRMPASNKAAVDLFVGRDTNDAPSGWTGIFKKYIPFDGTTTSDPDSVRDDFMNKYIDAHFPEVHNKSDPDSWRKAFMQKYIDNYRPQLKNENDAKEWGDAYVKSYGNKHLPDLNDKSDPAAWRAAFVKAYVDHFFNTAEPSIDSNQGREASKVSRYPRVVIDASAPKQFVLSPSSATSRPLQTTSRSLDVLLIFAAALVPAFALLGILTLGARRLGTDISEDDEACYYLQV